MNHGGGHGEAEVTRAWDGPRPAVSVVILTLNEEINIAACLDSCTFSDDVHVLDSYSSDATCEVAAARGAGVHRNKFVSFGAQRNWAIDRIPLKHDWVFHLDADERFTPGLVREMDGLLRKNPAEAGFHVPNKMMFMGRWLKRAGGYPAYQMRLFHKGRMRFLDHGHGQREDTKGALGTLREPYLHFNFSKGMADWFEKHNRYSTREAELALAARGEPLGLGGILSGDRVVRRRALKSLSLRLPMRPALRWMATMFVQGGVLEGRAGRTYADLLAVYQRMIDIKMRVNQSGADTGEKPAAAVGGAGAAGSGVRAAEAKA